MEKTDYDFGTVKQKILREARRLVETYQINTAHHCVRDLCELEEYVRRLKTYPGNDHEFITMHQGKYSCQFWERGSAKRTAKSFLKFFIIQISLLFIVYSSGLSMMKAEESVK